LYFWLEGQVTALSQSLQKGLFVRLGGFWGDIASGGLARLSRQVGGPAFNGKENGAGPAGRQAIE
jgi:hypothetical protein